MCVFFSLTSNGKGEIKYFDWELRQKCLKSELLYNPDSHTSINDYFGYKGAAEDCRNAYEYNPLTGKFTVDKLNTADDRKVVEEAVRVLDFKTIVPALVVKPIINPFKIKAGDVTEFEIGLLREWYYVRAYYVWDSITDSVGASIRDSVLVSVRNSAWFPVWSYIRNSVWSSIRISVGDYVWDSVWDSVEAYATSFFHIEEWKCVDHEPYKNPYQPAIDLWERGFVPSFDGKTWRLHAGEKADVVFKIHKDKLLAETEVHG